MIKSKPYALEAEGSRIALITKKHPSWVLFLLCSCFYEFAKNCDRALGGNRAELHIVHAARAVSLVGDSANDDERSTVYVADVTYRAALHLTACG